MKDEEAFDPGEMLKDLIQDISNKKEDFFSEDISRIILGEYETKLKSLMEDSVTTLGEVENLRSRNSFLEKRNSELQNEISRLQALNDQYLGYKKVQEDDVAQIHNLEKNIMEFEEKIKIIIMNTLDDVAAENVEKIIQVLKNIGVKNLMHIKYVREEDLENILNKIQTRILMEAFKSTVNDEKTTSLPTTRFTSKIVPEAPVIISSCNDLSSLEPINWDLLPKELMNTLRKGETIKTSELRLLVRIVADEILKMDPNPSRRLIRGVAENGVKKFPILKDNFNELKLGSGHDNLLYRLSTRIENLRRKSMESSDAPPRKSRRLHSYGCVAWAPRLANEVTVDDLVLKKDKLKKLNLSNNFEEAKNLLTDTFYIQRVEINKCSGIEGLVQEWPFLFTEQGIMLHFKILTEIEIHQTLETTILSKGQYILSYFRSSSNKKIKKFFWEVEKKNSNELLLIIKVLSIFFEDNSTEVFFTSKVLNPHNVTISVPKHPCLVGKGTCITRSEEFMLYIDSVPITTITDPATAVACWFASYFILNIDYPAQFSITMEFIQRCFVGINPVSGSKYERVKGKKMHSGVNPRILKLLNNIKEHELGLKDC